MDGLAAFPESGSGAGGAGDSDDDLKSRRLELRFGYGLPAFGGRFHLDAGGGRQPVGHRARLQPRLAPGTRWVR